MNCHSIRKQRSDRLGDFKGNNDAAVVRGSRVHIGKGCTIGRVEYTEAFSADAMAEVRTYYKIDTLH